MDDGPAATARPRRAVALLAALVAATTAGCLRLDTPLPEPSPADAVELARQGAAVDAERLALSAAGAAGDPAHAELLGTIAEGSAAHVRALGGVWEPWPSGAPADAEDAPHAPQAVPGADAATVLDLLASGAAAAHEAALEVADGELAGVLAAAAVWRAASARELADALGADVELPTGASYPVAGLAGWQMDTGTVLAFDAARYAYEVAAARSDGAAREAATARTGYLRDLSDVAAAALEEDPRQGVYGLPDAAVPAQIAAGAERVLLQQLLFRVTLTPPKDRAPLLAAAVDAAEQVRRWGGTVPPVPAE